MTQHRTTFEAIGTRWQIAVDSQLTATQWTGLLQRIGARIDVFDKAYSRFRSDSLVTALAKRGGTQPLPEDALPLLDFYKRLYRATDGSVTPLIGQVMSDAGYDAHYSFTSRPLTAPPAWEDVISYTPDSITLQKPIMLDFGAAGKGYLVDIISTMLADAGSHSYTINAGGDIAHHSKTALKVGLENPFNTSEAVGIALLSNQSLCASAGSKRTWGAYHHIIDPVTLSSPEEIVATWVIADDTMTADGIATALFFCDPIQLQTHFNFSFAILHQDMSLLYATDFPVTPFEAQHALH